MNRIYKIIISVLCVIMTIPPISVNVMAEETSETYRILVSSEEEISGNVIASYENTYLMQFDNSSEYEEAKNKYDYQEDYLFTLNEEINTTPEEAIYSDEPFSEEDNPFIYLEENLTNQEDISESKNYTSEDYSENENIQNEEDQVSKIRIALIDSGTNNENIQRVSFVGDSGYDAIGHGTQMCSYILSENENAEIISLKTFHDDGTSSVSEVYSALIWAIENDVDIINMSFNAYASEENKILTEIINVALEKGIKIVVSAGNNGKDAKDFIPANIEGVIAVGSLNEEGNRQEFSNYGNNIKYWIQSNSTSEAAALISGKLSKNEDISSYYKEFIYDTPEEEEVIEESDKQTPEEYRREVENMASEFKLNATKLKLNTKTKIASESTTSTYSYLKEEIFATFTGYVTQNHKNQGVTAPIGYARIQIVHELTSRTLNSGRAYAYQFTEDFTWKWNGTATDVHTGYQDAYDGNKWKYTNNGYIKTPKGDKFGVWGSGTTYPNTNQTKTLTYYLYIKPGNYTATQMSNGSSGRLWNYHTNSWNVDTGGNATTHALGTFSLEIPFQQIIRVRYQKADGTYGSYSTVKDESKFKGEAGPTWSRSADNIYQAKSTSAYTVTAAKTQSVDVPRKSYTYTFKITMPSGATGTVTNAQGNITKLAENTSGSIKTPALTGYKFLGYFDSSGNAYKSEKMLSNKTFTGKFEKILYPQIIKVRYQKADGTYSSYSEVKNEQKGLNEDGPTWSIAENNIYFAKSTSAYTVTGEKTQSVDVPRKSYTYTFKVEKPTGATETIQNEQDNITKLAENTGGAIKTPTLTGYDFLGYFDEDGKSYNSSEKMLSNKTFTGRFTNGSPINIKVVWDDNSDTRKLRPSTVDVFVTYEHGGENYSYIVPGVYDKTNDNYWTITTPNIPTSATSIMAYQMPIDNYDTDYTPDRKFSVINRDETVVITNTMTAPTEKEIIVRKEWDDNDNPNRPTSVIINGEYKIQDQDMLSSTINVYEWVSKITENKPLIYETIGWESDTKPAYINDLSDSVETQGELLGYLGSEYAGRKLLAILEPAERYGVKINGTSYISNPYNAHKLIVYELDDNGNLGNLVSKEYVNATYSISPKTQGTVYNLKTTPLELNEYGTYHDFWYQVDYDFVPANTGIKTDVQIHGTYPQLFDYNGKTYVVTLNRGTEYYAYEVLSVGTGTQPAKINNLVVTEYNGQIANFNINNEQMQIIKDIINNNDINEYKAFKEYNSSYNIEISEEAFVSDSNTPNMNNSLYSGSKMYSFNIYEKHFQVVPFSINLSGDWEEQISLPFEAYDIKIWEKDIPVGYSCENDINNPLQIETEGVITNKQLIELKVIKHWNDTGDNRPSELDFTVSKDTHPVDIPFTFAEIDENTWEYTGYISGDEDISLYTVSENSIEGYKPREEYDDIPFEYIDGVYVVEFTNDETFEIAVEKNVSGNMGNKNKSFMFTIEFFNHDGFPLETSLDAPDNATLTGAGVYIFELSHGDTITFSNIPYGYRYKISEDDYSYEGYKTYIDEEKSLSVEGYVNKDTHHVFNNKNNSAIPTEVFIDNNIILYSIGIIGIVIVLIGRVLFRKESID